MIFSWSDQNYRLKWLFSNCKNGAWGNEPDGEKDIVCIRAANFEGTLGRLKKGNRTLRSIDSVTYEKLALRDGDIILEKSGGGEKQLVGRAALFKGQEPSITSNFLARCRPAPSMNPVFVNYLLLAIYNARGTFPHLKQSIGIQNLDLASFLDIRISVPELNTQRRIAQYLDDKIARIDRLIEKKRELLDRLAEKRQALITQAVIKGISPGAPMKPTGIDWLGDIPAHWNLERLKFITSVPLAYGANAAAEFDEPEWPRYVRITDVDELGRLRDETFRSLPPEIAKKFLLKPNDILLARSGATVGKSIIYKESWGIACYAGYLIRARVKKEHDARYFYWFLNSISYWEWVRSTFIQSTIQNISADRYANLHVPFPPDRDEQNQIIDFIEVSCSKIDCQWEKIERSLERLHEYRAALITEAVTGQLSELR